LIVSEANKDIVRRYQDAYNRNDLDVLDEVLDPNWTTNGWPEVMPQTIENAKELYQVLLASFPDLSYETLDLIAEGDTVVQHWKARCTFKGELFGVVPPTGELIVADGISIFRLAGGKIVEHVAFADDFGFWEQAGVEFPEFLSVAHHKTSGR
jgi:predicted ester cyclase